jgi:hypothetical protein
LARHRLDLERTRREHPRHCRAAPIGAPSFEFERPACQNREPLVRLFVGLEAETLDPPPQPLLPFPDLFVLGGLPRRHYPAEVIVETLAEHSVGPLVIDRDQGPVLWVAHHPEAHVAAAPVAHEEGERKGELPEILEKRVAQVLRPPSLREALVLRKLRW